MYWMEERLMGILRDERRVVKVGRSGGRREEEEGAIEGRGRTTTRLEGNEAMKISSNLVRDEEEGTYTDSR